MKNRQIRAIAPLQSWDIFSNFLVNHAIHARKIADHTTLNNLRSKNNWNIDLSLLLDEDYTTIVVTNREQHIEWVNSDFSEMTGYTKAYALGKHPRFLQGTETSTSARKQIKKALTRGETVNQQLLNYKKDGTTYLCDIKIIPLFDNKKELTHFMALEKKAQVA